MVGTTVSNYRVLLAGIFLTIVLVTAQAPPESADLIITNGRVIDGKGAVYDRATIAITRERIKSITSGERQFNAAKTINAKGKTVLPGLIDTHMHLTKGGATDEQTLAEYLTNKLLAELETYLSHGVTTIKATGDIVETYVEVRERLVRGEILGPRLFLAGPVLTALVDIPLLRFSEIIPGDVLDCHGNWPLKRKLELLCVSWAS